MDVTKIASYYIQRKIPKLKKPNMAHQKKITVKPVQNDHPWGPKKWAVVGKVVVIRPIKLVNFLVGWGSGWLFFTGCCCSEVVVNTNLTLKT